MLLLLLFPFIYTLESHSENSQSITVRTLFLSAAFFGYTEIAFVNLNKFTYDRLVAFRLNECFVACVLGKRAFFIAKVRRI